MIEQHYGVLLILGISAFVGLFGAWFFQRIKFPQVVGYIAVGLLLGPSGIGLVDREHISSLEPFTFFALGMIGFLVGGELKVSEFRKYGRQFMAILLGEGLAAFLLVGIGTGALLYLLSGTVATAIAGGIVLGAIASATDPASTIDVLWEYRAKGMVTTALVAIIALDDALAMTLYSIGKSVAGFLAGDGMTLSHELTAVARELGGAMLVAACAAWVLRLILLRTHNKDRALAISISTLFLVIGLAVTFGMDVILAAMTLGFGISNLLPKRSRELFHTARSMSLPIYALFFVLVGARFDIAGIPPLMWLIAAVYVAGRSIGKFTGTWSGARLSGADPKIRRYAGLGLFAQGGVAIGLAIVAGRNLEGIAVSGSMNLGECVVAVVTATTIAVQIIGPVMTRLAVRLAGETDKNVTEEDVMSAMPLADIVQAQENPLREDDTVDRIIEVFSNDAGQIKTVTDKQGRFSGVISFNSLRETLPDRDLWQWLLASDIMDHSFESIRSDASVLDAMHIMNDTHAEALVVRNAADPQEVSGIIELGRARRAVKRKLLEQLA